MEKKICKVEYILIIDSEVQYKSTYIINMGQPTNVAVGYFSLATRNQKSSLVFQQSHEVFQKVRHLIL